MEVVSALLPVEAAASVVLLVEAALVVSLEVSAAWPVAVVRVSEALELLQVVLVDPVAVQRSSC